MTLLQKRLKLDSKLLGMALGIVLREISSEIIIVFIIIGQQIVFSPKFVVSEVAIPSCYKFTTDWLLVPQAVFRIDL